MYFLILTWCVMMKELEDRHAVLERRLAATQQEVADLSYDINALTSIIAQARKFGTWNVRN